MSSNPHQIKVVARSQYVEEQSNPALARYVFAYTITIENTGEAAAQLISRHWVITDANGKVEEVRGDGVVGEQPLLVPGETFRYTSGAVLETPLGTMQGSYQMVGQDGTQFDAQIPVFRLAVPHALH